MTGFTTSEAERVVQHPVRRRIIMTLMVLRSAGAASDRLPHGAEP